MGRTVNTGCSHLLSLSCTIMCPRGATGSLLDSYLARPPGGWHCDCSGEKKEKERSLFMIDWMIKSHIPPNNRKINLPKKFLYCIIRHFPIFQQSTDPSDADSCFALSRFSHFKQNCVLGRFVTIWLLIPVQCTRTATRTPDTTIVPEQLLAPCTRYHCIDTRAAPRVGCISRVQSGL